jgi:hypothetical protein
MSDHAVSSHTYGPAFKTWSFETHGDTASVAKVSKLTDSSRLYHDSLPYEFWSLDHRGSHGNEYSGPNLDASSGCHSFLRPRDSNHVMDG